MPRQGGHRLSPSHPRLGHEFVIGRRRRRRNRGHIPVARGRGQRRSDLVLDARPSRTCVHDATDLGGQYPRASFTASMNSAPERVSRSEAEIQPPVVMPKSYELASLQLEQPRQQQQPGSRRKERERRVNGLAVREGCIYSDHAADLAFVPSARHGQAPWAHDLTGSTASKT